MRILILGNDGYIGHSLTIHLLKLGHEVFGVDNYSRRKRVNEIKGDSLTPISPAIGRRNYLKHTYKNFIGQVDIHLGYDQESFIAQVIDNFQPNTVVHLAEQPSAPWSMMSASTAAFTQAENVIGTLHLLWAIYKECPDAHLVKLGTMGEYGVPNCDIPEGRIPKSCINSDDRDCLMGGLLFPRTPGSFYHASKVMDSINIEFACRNWGLCSTDIMQGVVFGLNEHENDEELTRFDYDEYFGTAINRFCAQAIIEHPLTIYGNGHQTRGFLTLQDSLQCITLAILNPPQPGEYRTFNQFENTYSISSLAKMVLNAAKHLNLTTAINYINNPRNEEQDHYYNPVHEKLLNLGYRPNTDIQGEITRLIRQLLPFKSRVNKQVIYPTTSWT